MAKTVDDSVRPSTVDAKRWADIVDEGRASPGIEDRAWALAIVATDDNVAHVQAGEKAVVEAAAGDDAMLQLQVALQSEVADETASEGETSGDEEASRHGANGRTSVREHRRRNNAVVTFNDDFGIGNTTETTVLNNVDLFSVGSRCHEAGRCKPCAFFHTKGCQSGAQCLFCHLCPPLEKQRRKRLRRAICSQYVAFFEPQGFVRDRNFKVGHSRMGSDASAATASTCTGWDSGAHSGTAHRWQHSREWSTSTQDSCADVQGLVGYGGVAVGTGDYDFGVTTPVASGGMAAVAVSPASASAPSPSVCGEQETTCDAGDAAAASPSSPKRDDKAGDVQDVAASATTAVSAASGNNGSAVQQAMPPGGGFAHPCVAATTAQRYGQHGGFVRASAQPLVPQTSYVTCGGMHYALIPVPAQHCAHQQYVTYDAATGSAHVQMLPSYIGGELDMQQQQVQQHQQQHPQHQQHWPVGAVPVQSISAEGGGQVYDTRCVQQPGMTQVWW